MPITPIFVALFTLMLLFLSVAVIRQRLQKQVSLGSDGHRGLEIAIRTHANFVEYVPMCLLLMWSIEQLTQNSHLVLILGEVLLLVRIAHVIGMRYPKKFFRLRQIGILGTFAVMIVGSFTLLWHYLPISI